MRRLALALALALLAGCGAGGAEPERPAEPERRPPARGPEQPPPTLQSNNIASAQPQQPAVLHWDALRIRYAEVERLIAEGKVKDDPWVEYTLGLGEQMGVSFVAIRGQVTAPPRPIDEVFVLVEGKDGLAVIDGQPARIDTGSILFLPAGSRGAITAAADDPLLFLRVGAAPPADFAQGVRSAPGAGKRRGWAMKFDEFERKVAEAEARGARDKVKRAQLIDIEALPGRLSVHAHSIPYMVKGQAGAMLPISTPIQRHDHHDQVVLILYGEGNMGIGSSPNRVKGGTVAFVPAGLTWYLQNADMNTGTLALSVYGPSFDPADVILDEPAAGGGAAPGDAGRGPR